MKKPERDFVTGHVQFAGKTLALHEVELLLKHRAKARDRERKRREKRLARREQEDEP